MEEVQGMGEKAIYEEVEDVIGKEEMSEGVGYAAGHDKIKWCKYCGSQTIKEFHMDKKGKNWTACTHCGLSVSYPNNIIKGVKPDGTPLFAMEYYFEPAMKQYGFNANGSLANHEGGVKWTLAEEAIMKEHYETMGSDIKTLMPERSSDSIHKKAKRMGLFKRTEFVEVSLGAEIEME